METLKYSIKTTRTTKSKINEVDWDNIQFGKVFSDHILIMDYQDGEWKTPEIKPFDTFKMHPANSALHYGQSIFEGVKAYKTVDGKPVIFRLDRNAKRFRKSAERMCMTDIPEDLFEFCVKELIKFDSDWVPDRKGYSLYIRPFMFATDEYIGIRPSNNYRFVVFTCPVGAYYNEPLSVKIEEKYSRVADGGTGIAKTAGNYAASLYPAKLGKEEGFHQLLWTDCKSHKYIEESGTMNVLFVIGDTLITPTEDGDTVLLGITKRSVIDLAKDWGMNVEERKVTVAEIITALENGTLKEAFGAGTAATIAPINIIGYRGKKYELPGDEARTFSNKVYEELNAIKIGEIEDRFGWLTKL